MSTIPERPTSPQSLSPSFRSAALSHLTTHAARLQPVLTGVVVCALFLGISIFHPVVSQPAAIHGMLAQVVAPTSSCSGVMADC